MSDAPAGAAPTGPQTPAQPAPTNGVKSNGSNGAPKGEQKTGAAALASINEWSEKDDAALTEMLKRSPHSKRKVNGKEETISSLEDWKRWVMDSQRGVGANRVVEEAKKQAEAGRTAEEKLKAMEARLERVKKGDRDALRELGFDDGSEKQTQDALASLPPEVQDIVRANQEMARRLQEHEAEKQRQAQEKEQATVKQTREATLAEARQLLPELLADIQPEHYEAELPGLIFAMTKLKSEGSRLGVDYTVEQLREYVGRMRDAGIGERVSRMKPGAALKMLGPTLKSLKPDELVEALGEDFMPLGRVFSEAWTKHWRKRREAPPVAQQRIEEKKPAEKPKPLSPMRFK